MAQNVRFVVSLTVRDGQLQEFEGVMREMVAGTLQEPGALAYDFYFDADKKRCKLFEEYRDAAATLAHLRGPVVTKLIPRLLNAAELDAFEVYGDPGREATAILEGFGAAIYLP